MEKQPLIQTSQTIAPKPTSKTIEDKDLIESLLFLKTNKLVNQVPMVKFETTKEAEDSTKEDVVALIKEKTNTIRSDISDIQKKRTQYAP